MLRCFGIKAMAGNEGDCYLQAGDKTYVGTDIKTGLAHTKIVLSDGSFVEVDNHDITAYRHHGKVYMKMPVICDTKDTLCLALMEYITSNKGFSVFRYCCTLTDDTSPYYQCKEDHFFVFKNGNFYRRIDEGNTEALRAYGIKVIEEIL